MRWRRVLLIRSGCRVQAGPGAGDNCPHTGSIQLVLGWPLQGENCNKTPDTRITAAAADPPRPVSVSTLQQPGWRGGGV